MIKRHDIRPRRKKGAPRAADEIDDDDSGEDVLEV
jgi:hypothetical protein